jgi:hypothetical protein
MRSIMWQTKLRRKAVGTLKVAHMRLANGQLAWHMIVRMAPSLATAARYSGRISVSTGRRGPGAVSATLQHGGGAHRGG